MTHFLGYYDLSVKQCYLLLAESTSDISRYDLEVRVRNIGVWLALVVK